MPPLVITKPIYKAVSRGRPLAVFMPWPKQKPLRLLTHGKPYKSKPGRRTRTLVKHDRIHKMRERIEVIEGDLDPIWGDPYEAFGLCGDVILDPHNLPAPHPGMEKYSWWENHRIHDHETYGQYTTLGDVPGVNVKGHE